MVDVLPLLTFGAVSLAVAVCLVAWPRTNASAETAPATGTQSIANTSDRQHTDRFSDGVVVLATGMVITAVIVMMFAMFAGGRVTGLAVPIAPILGLIGSVGAGLLYSVRKRPRTMSPIDDSTSEQSDEDDIVTEQ